VDFSKGALQKIKAGSQKNGAQQPSWTLGNYLTGRVRKVNSFHEKAGWRQVGFFLGSFCEFVSIEPSRLCRNPSIRTLL